MAEAASPGPRPSGPATWLLVAAVLLVGAGALALVVRSRAEPRRVTVRHILISFVGGRTSATRTREQAEKLAHETLARVRAGEDFGKIAGELSDDRTPGIYSMCNTGVPPGPNEHPRTSMVAAFGNTSFSLDVGDVGMAPYDQAASPFGWHIIKRLK